MEGDESRHEQLQKFSHGFWLREPGCFGKNPAMMSNNHARLVLTGYGDEGAEFVLKMNHLPLRDPESIPAIFGMEEIPESASVTKLRKEAQWKWRQSLFSKQKEQWQREENEKYGLVENDKYGPASSSSRKPNLTQDDNMDFETVVRDDTKVSGREFKSNVPRRAKIERGQSPQYSMLPSKITHHEDDYT
jgi:hypothetical protein